MPERSYLTCSGLGKAGQSEPARLPVAKSASVIRLRAAIIASRGAETVAVLKACASSDATTPTTPVMEGEDAPAQRIRDGRDTCDAFAI